MAAWLGLLTEVSPRISYTTILFYWTICLFLNITLAFELGMVDVSKQKLQGRSNEPFSNCTSYSSRIWANMALISLTAKNRPGLQDVHQLSGSTVKEVIYHACRPCPKTIWSKFRETSWCLMLSSSPSPSCISENRNALKEWASGNSA